MKFDGVVACVPISTFLYRSTSWWVLRSSPRYDMPMSSVRRHPDGPEGCATCAAASAAGTTLLSNERPSSMSARRARLSRRSRFPSRRVWEAREVNEDSPVVGDEGDELGTGVMTGDEWGMETKRPMGRGGWRR